MLSNLVSTGSRHQEQAVQSTTSATGAKLNRHREGHLRVHLALHDNQRNEAKRIAKAYRLQNRFPTNRSEARELRDVWRDSKPIVVRPSVRPQRSPPALPELTDTFMKVSSLLTGDALALYVADTLKEPSPFDPERTRQLRKVIHHVSSHCDDPVTQGHIEDIATRLSSLAGGGIATISGTASSFAATLSSISHLGTTIDKLSGVIENIKETSAKGFNTFEKHLPTLQKALTYVLDLMLDFYAASLIPADRVLSWLALKTATWAIRLRDDAMNWYHKLVEAITPFFTVPTGSPAPVAQGWTPIMLRDLSKTLLSIFGLDTGSPVPDSDVRKMGSVFSAANSGLTFFGKLSTMLIKAFEYVVRYFGLSSNPVDAIYVELYDKGFVLLGKSPLDPGMLNLFIDFDDQYRQLEVTNAELTLMQRSALNSMRHDLAAKIRIARDYLRDPSSRIPQCVIHILNSAPGIGKTALVSAIAHRAFALAGYASPTMYVLNPADRFMSGHHGQSVIHLDEPWNNQSDDDDAYVTNIIQTIGSGVKMQTNQAEITEKGTNFIQARLMIGTTNISRPDPAHMKIRTKEALLRRFESVHIDVNEKFTAYDRATRRYDPLYTFDHTEAMFEAAFTFTVTQLHKDVADVVVGKYTYSQYVEYVARRLIAADKTFKSGVWPEQAFERSIVDNIHLRIKHLLNQKRTTNSDNELSLLKEYMTPEDIEIYQKEPIAQGMIQDIISRFRGEPTHFILTIADEEPKELPARLDKERIRSNPLAATSQKLVNGKLCYVLNQLGSTNAYVTNVMAREPIWLESEACDFMFYGVPLPVSLKSVVTFKMSSAAIALGSAAIGLIAILTIGIKHWFRDISKPLVTPIGILRGGDKLVLGAAPWTQDDLRPLVDLPVNELVRDPETQLPINGHVKIPTSIGDFRVFLDGSILFEANGSSLTPLDDGRLAFLHNGQPFHPISLDPLRVRVLGREVLLTGVPPQVAMAQSYDLHDKNAKAIFGKKSGPREVLGKLPVAQGIVAGDPLYSKIVMSLVPARLTRDEDGSSITIAFTCVAIGGTWLITNRHSLHSFFTGKTCRMSVERFGSWSEYFPLSNGIVSAIQTHDLCGIHVPSKYFADAPNIIPLFIYDTEVDDAHVCNAKLVSRIRDTRIPMAYIRDAGTVTFVGSIKVLDPNSDATYVTNDVVRYPLNTESGDCMSILVSESPRQDRVLFGFHTAGARNGDAYGIVITQTLLKKIVEPAKIEGAIEPVTGLPLADVPIVTAVGQSKYELTNSVPVYKLDAPPYIPRSSGFVRSHFDFERDPNTLARIPVVLTNMKQGTIDPLALAIAKFDTPNVELTTQQHVIRRRAELLLMVYIKSFKPRGPEKTSRDDIINGPVFDLSTPVKLQTSMGGLYGPYRKKGGKWDFFARDDKGRIFLLPEGEKVYYNLVNRLEAGKGIDFICPLAMKDELRPPDRVWAGKVRTTFAFPAIESILLREYLHCFIDAVERCPEIAVGVNPFSRNFSDRINDIKNHGAQVIAGDISNNDATNYAYEGTYLYELVTAWYNHHFPDSRLSATRDLLFKKFFLERAVALGDKVWVSRHHWLSGFPYTSYFQSIVNQARLCTASLDILSTKNRPLYAEIDTYTKYRVVVQGIFYGDDLMAGVRTSEIDNFTIAEAYAKYGHIYTDPEKSSTHSRYGIWYEERFIKRRLVHMPLLNVYFAPLPEGIVEAIPYYLMKDPRSEAEKLADCFDSALREWFHHGREKFDTYLAMYNDHARRVGMNQSFLTYDQLLDEFLRSY